MKYLYLTILLFFSLNSYGQDNLLGEWFLHYIEVSDVQHYSTIPNSLNTITFYDDNSYHGAVCSNGYGGSYIENSNNTLYITNFAALA